MPLDGPALARALGPEAGRGLDTVHSTLCRREAGAFQRASKDGADRSQAAWTAFCQALYASAEFRYLN